MHFDFKFFLFLLGLIVAFMTFRKPKPKPALPEADKTKGSDSEGK